MLVSLGIGVHSDHLPRAGGEDVGSVPLAAGEVGDLAACHPRRDPFVDGQVTPEPVVLLREVGEGALSGQRKGRNAVRLVVLLIGDESII